MSSLPEFLLARIAEDEAVAHEASRRGEHYVEAGVHWHWVNRDTDEPIRLDPVLDEYLFGPSLRSVEEFPTASVGPLPQFAIAGAEDLPTVVGQHIARWDPARVLAECDAKRRIVEDVAENYLDHAGGIESTDGLAWRALEYLALPYADHQDYRQEWNL